MGDRSDEEPQEPQLDEEQTKIARKFSEAELKVMYRVRTGEDPTETRQQVLLWLSEQVINEDFMSVNPVGLLRDRLEGKSIFQVGLLSELEVSLILVKVVVAVAGVIGARGQLLTIRRSVGGAGSC